MCLGKLAVAMAAGDEGAITLPPCGPHINSFCLGMPVKASVAIYLIYTLSSVSHAVSAGL